MGVGAEGGEGGSLYKKNSFPIDDTIDITITANVDAQEDVIVPAGTFADCYKIIYNSIMVINFSSWGDFPLVLPIYVWFKPGVGRTKMHIQIDLPDPFEDIEYLAELESYFLT